MRIIHLNESVDPDVGKLLDEAEAAASRAYEALVRGRWVYARVSTMEDHALVIRCIPVEPDRLPDHLTNFLSGRASGEQP